MNSKAETTIDESDVGDVFESVTVLLYQTYQHFFAATIYIKLPK